MSVAFVDIHCHLLPGIDDGARGWDEALAMARSAAKAGTTTIVATPHQLGTYGANHGDDIRSLASELQLRLDDAGVPLAVLPGAEIRIEPGLVEQLARGELVSLGDHGRHVLLELPHELYLPIESLLSELAARRATVILAHPERNRGIARQLDLLGPLVDAGCLMQITAGSLSGALGPDVQKLAEWMVAEGLVHLVATDAHSPHSRRPLLGSAYERLCELADEGTALDLCSRYPARVAAGRTVPAGRRSVRPRRRGGWWARRASA